MDNGFPQKRKEQKREKAKAIENAKRNPGIMCKWVP